MATEIFDASFEKWLYKFAVKINEEIGLKVEALDENSTCSIFLKDIKRDAYVLRASTNGTFYLGKAQLNTSKENRIEFEKEEERIGITASAIFSCESKIVDNIEGDKYYSCYNMKDSEYQDWANNNYCEYDMKNIRSILIVPIFFSYNEEPFGVVRVVRNKSIEKCFDKNDENNLDSLIREELNSIKSGVFLSKLIELGTYMDIPNICSNTVDVLKVLLSAKACSIFLLDDKYINIEKDGAQKTVKKELIYKCYGTTGLVKHQGKACLEIGDPLWNEDAWYKYYPDDPRMEKGERPELSITMGVVRARVSAFLKDVNVQKEIDDLFPEAFKIMREVGPGKVSEYFEDEQGKFKYNECGNALFSPMFYVDPNDQFVHVLGVVRIQRAKNEEDFSLANRHLFVSLVERLSKAISFARLIKFVNNFSMIEDRRQLYEYMIKNLPKFIGGTDCALLVRDTYDHNIFRVRAEWRKGEFEWEPDKPVYDIEDEDRTGYSGFVAKERCVLRFNGPKDLEEKKRHFYNTRGPNRVPKHHIDSKDEPHRFLGVPIPGLSDTRKPFAVIRICKDEKTSVLTEEDEKVLSLIANRARPYIEKFIDEDERLLKIESLIEVIFSKELQNKIERLEKITCKDEIDAFFKDIRANVTNVPIEKQILDFLHRLWKFYIPEKSGRQIDYLEDFEFFNKNVLSEVPFYRDHFVHQFVVFLTGIVIIDGIHDSFVDTCKKAYPASSIGDIDNKEKGDVDNEEANKKLIEQSWLITAIFHDTAYPLEKLNSWLNNFLYKITRDGRNENFVNLPLDGLLFRPDYIDRIDRLSRYFEENMDFRGKSKFREIIINELSIGNVDHGIMGALFLLGDTGYAFKDILPSASAIALHNNLLYKIDHKIEFKKHPFAFLLIYCDLLHEWGRNISGISELEKNAPNLGTIKVDSLKKLKNEGIVDVDDSIDEKKECVFVGISINDEKIIAKKQEEINNVFNKIDSSEIMFFMKLNNRIFPEKYE